MSNTITLKLADDDGKPLGQAEIAEQLAVLQPAQLHTLLYAVDTAIYRAEAGALEVDDDFGGAA